jgi:hypothetical protein
MKSHIAFRFGEVLISTEALASPLFEDVISRHREHPPDICRVMMTRGCRVEISEKLQLRSAEMSLSEKHALDRQLIGALSTFQKEKGKVSK